MRAMGEMFRVAPGWKKTYLAVVEGVAARNGMDLRTAHRAGSEKILARCEWNNSQDGRESEKRISAC